MQADPLLNIDKPMPSQRFPKTLSEKQVEDLLAAPDVDTPLGLRDRAMLELLYATGLRVSELVGAAAVRGEPQRQRGARDRQGRQGAPGAARADRRRWLQRYLADGAAGELLKGRTAPTRCSSPRAAAP